MKLIPGTCKVITVSRDCTAKVWDIETGYLENALIGHKDWVRAVDYY